MRAFGQRAGPREETGRRAGMREVRSESGSRASRLARSVSSPEPRSGMRGTRRTPLGRSPYRGERQSSQEASRFRGASPRRFSDSLGTPYTLYNPRLFDRLLACRRQSLCQRRGMREPIHHRLVSFSSSFNSPSIGEYLHRFTGRRGEDNLHEESRQGWVEGEQMARVEVKA